MGVSGHWDQNFLTGSGIPGHANSSREVSGTEKGEKGRKRGSSTDEEWKMEEEDGETRDRKTLTQNKTKSPKSGSKRAENETEVSSLSEAEGGVPSS